jgi:hypothetical protein
MIYLHNQHTQIPLTKRISHFESPTQTTGCDSLFLSLEKHSQNNKTQPCNRQPKANHHRRHSECSGLRTPFRTRGPENPKFASTVQFFSLSMFHPIQIQ